MDGAHQRRRLRLRGGGSRPHEHEASRALVGKLGRERVAHVEARELAGILDAALRHPADHRAARRLARGRALDGPAVAQALAEDAGGDLRAEPREPRGHRLRVLHAREVDHVARRAAVRPACALAASALAARARAAVRPVRARADLPRDRVAPEAVEVARAVDGQRRAHLEPVGEHGVEGADAAVEAGEDAQVRADPVERGAVHHRGGHALVLDARVGEDGRRDAGGEGGVGEVGAGARQAVDAQAVEGLQAGGQQPVAHAPQALQVGCAHAGEHLEQPRRAPGERGDVARGDAVDAGEHLLGGGDDDAEHGRGLSGGVGV